MLAELFSRGLRWRVVAYLAMIVCLLVVLKPWGANAQAPADNKATQAKAADKKFDEAMTGPAPKKEAPADGHGGKSGVDLTKIPPMNYWELFQKGGVLMYPIVMMSIVAAAFAIERFFGLRRRKLVPRKLIDEFGDLSAKIGAMDLREAYRLCQKYPSAASNVIRAMLLKTGRPIHEIERIVDDASAREAALMYKNVRPLVLTVTVTPLMGLLGTVAGMITAFYVTANMPVGGDKATYLADGIYVKLLTTFAGLIVAIPSLILAHWYEGIIQTRRREIDELVHSLLPQIERFEGKLRTNRQQLAGELPTVKQADGRRQPVPSGTQRQVE